MKNLTLNKIALLFFGLALLANSINAQTALPTPPPPSAPRPVKIPAIQETKLPNGLRVVVVERKNVPLVQATLLIKTGAAQEGEKAGLADLTASTLLKGTKTRTATQIAEQIEFLGGNIDSRTNWETSTVSVNVTSDKIEQAMTVMADAVLNPAFARSEIDLLKTQTLDELNVALKQPSTLANFAAARYTFGEHSVVGTPESLTNLSRADIAGYYKNQYKPENSILIFVGDVSKTKADALAKRLFGVWKRTPPRREKEVFQIQNTIPRVPPSPKNTVEKILVVDLPNSGQAAVSYTRKLDEGRMRCFDIEKCENSDVYFPAVVSNAVLGGGYSARLNMEIRIKRGLSYGAGSNFNWRIDASNFATRVQTKNISAAEVADLTVQEIEKMTTGEIASVEMTPRKLSLTGDFGRDLSTNAALTQRLIELYSFYLVPDVLRTYVNGVDKVSDADIKKFVASNVKGGNLIIVGDYKVFADDLKKRFPNQTVEVIPASQLDLNRNDLKKQTK